MNEQLPKFFFLCGVGRSGTTALRTSLGTHEQIYYNGFENNLVQEVADVAMKNCTMKSRERAMIVSRWEYDAHFRKLLRSLIWPDQQMAQRPVHMAAINPTPKQLDYLTQLFPGSKFVGLVRNGIEVVSSRMEFRSFADKTFDSHCDAWNRSAEVLKWGKQNPDSFRLIRHEWFYAPTKLKTWMHEFNEWLGIDGSVAPVQKLLGTLEHPTSSRLSFDHSTFSKSTIADKRDYFLSKRNRWRNWTPGQMAEFEERCGQSMTRLNYNIPWNEMADDIQAAG